MATKNTLIKYKCKDDFKVQFEYSFVTFHFYKFIGTSKINNNCTSTIKAEFLAKGGVLVEICHTHYGHDKELQQGVTKEKILDEIRDSVGSQFNRLHLLERRDLHNISRAFGLDEVQRHENDQHSTLAWIKEWEEMPNNPVLFYKK